MHKALGGHNFVALLEGSSDLITHFGLFDDCGSFVRLLKQFLKILLGIFPIKCGHLGTQTIHFLCTSFYLSGILLDMSKLCQIIL